ncbi:MAG: hypothetical protein IT338_19455 [Thermomicrobiales bacterium]|nr:hypothetical protein [Thermomicrobiales bacterium]
MPNDKMVERSQNTVDQWKGEAMSQKTIAEKLRITPDSTVWAAPAARLELIGPLPDGARVVDAPDDAATALIFADDRGSLQAMLATHGERLAEPGSLWVAYRKANRADINRDSLWPILAGYGMRPIGQVAVDDVWSAMRFRPLKPGEAPFTGGK